MEYQPIEVIAQEPWRRREKIRRVLGASLFSLLALTGAFTTKFKENSSRAEALPMVVTPNQQELDREELQALKAAHIKSYEAREQVTKFYNMLIWNKAVEDNRPRITYDAARWYSLHQCEQPDSWYADGYNPADPSHQRFQGGLGMSTVAWSMAVLDAAKRGVSLPASALDASVDQQMQAAQVFWNDEGWGWGCHV